MRSCTVCQRRFRVYTKHCTVHAQRILCFMPTQSNGVNASVEGLLALYLVDRAAPSMACSEKRRSCWHRWVLCKDIRFVFRCSWYRSAWIFLGLCTANSCLILQSIDGKVHASSLQAFSTRLPPRRGKCGQTWAQVDRPSPCDKARKASPQPACWRRFQLTCLGRWQRLFLIVRVWGKIA